MSSRVTPAIIVHGGAWAIPDDMAEASRRGVKDAVLRGYQVRRRVLNEDR